MRRCPRFPACSALHAFPSERGTGKSRTLVLAGALRVLRVPLIGANLNRPRVPV